MTTRHFFTKAHQDERHEFRADPLNEDRCHHCGTDRSTHWAPRVNPRHQGKSVWVVMDKSGKKQLMSSRAAAHRMGVSKGGKMIHALGKAHQWTSEEARKAARKGWKHKGRLATRIGIRVGRSAKRRPRVVRAPLRAQYAWVTGQGPRPLVWFDQGLGQWFAVSILNPLAIYKVSERAALVRLGYLPSAHGPVPGTILATYEPKKGRKRDETTE